jgi:phosphoglycerate dehydrogenase-like enzyme
VPGPRILIAPNQPAWATETVLSAGGELSGPDEAADALIWLDSKAIEALGEVLAGQPSIRWVQLPFAGIERVVRSGLIDSKRLWTSAKGSYAEPVAEHALALALAGLRYLPERITAKTWGKPAAESLYDEEVVILGGGGITTSLLELLAPMRVKATVIRRRNEPVAGAWRTLGPEGLHQALPSARVVFLALALTPATTGIIGRNELSAMDQGSWLINVARGPHVVTDDLVEALSGGWIAGAALDVTDPEPLPDGHPLWDLPNCIITPHTADTEAMIQPRLNARIAANVKRFVAGEDLIGLVDPDAGY